ncbi:extensin family protein [Aquicoccus sp. G2-2]|uniref:extensin-like domain-containing protein n=1 Tax=Aquicoccus sp. G2-2 TaxID=3092120 RepID=UPI002ADFD4E0|nr:extensin family protein [Aquicoccus sp. G2-2]MEA1113651.1 extensin family protein [Aquicoccus sp. G2-2]
MRHAALAVLAMTALIAGAAAAQAPESSLRPVARVMKAAVMPVHPPAALPVIATAAPVVTGPRQTVRPRLRTKKVGLFGWKRKRELERGKICGDRAIQGTVIGRVRGRIKGCGVANAVKVRSIEGIGFTQQPIMDCTTAKALKTWVDKGLKPSVGQRGGGVARLDVAAHYACRTRNNQKGAKLSEHGKGHAIDISGVVLKNGTTLSVLRDWRKGWKGKALRRMHKLACGPFGTVLGPNANRFHRNHFHFDTARYRGGPYCR